MCSVFVCNSSTEAPEALHDPQCMTAQSCSPYITVYPACVHVCVSVGCVCVCEMGVALGTCVLS